MLSLFEPNKDRLGNPFEDCFKFSRCWSKIGFATRLLGDAFEQLLAIEIWIPVGTEGYIGHCIPKADRENGYVLTVCVIDLLVDPGKGL